MMYMIKLVLGKLSTFCSDKFHRSVILILEMDFSNSYKWKSPQSMYGSNDYTSDSLLSS